MKLGSVLFAKLANAALEGEVRSSLRIFLIVLFTVLFIQWFIKYWNDLMKLPPGPWGLPIIGYLPFMEKEKHTSFINLAKKYGSVFCTRLGNQLTVVISDYRVVRDNFTKTEFSSRPDTPFMQTIEGYGIINSVGKLWKDERRFLFDNLRHLGMTYFGVQKHQMQNRIMTEVHDYLNYLTGLNGKPVNVEQMLAIGTSNVICDMLMSVRFYKDDPVFKRFNFLLDEGMRLFGEIFMIEYVPMVQYLPGKINVKNKIAQNRREMFDFYRKVIDDHKKVFDPNNLRDLVDIYLNEIEQAKEQGRELFEGKDHDQQIMQIISDLFSAGNETVKSTLLWMNVFMLHNPHVMAKVKEELDRVVGRNRLPTFADLTQLPYTEGTIMESLRRASIVPLGTTHATLYSTKLNGYTIPAGVQVVPLIGSIHMDPQLWDKPEEFNPERFYDQYGRVHPPSFFMPFGVGRRRCLGDTLAKMEMFLFFACTMHAFDISLPEGAELPSLNGNVGIVISPQATEICFTPRPLNLDNDQKTEQLMTHMDGVVRNIGSKNRIQMAKSR